MSNPPSAALLDHLAALLGEGGFTRDPQDIEPWLTDWRGRYRGAAAAMLSPRSLDQVVAIVRAAASERVAIVPQGGNSSMVGGSVPDGSRRALLLSMRRMAAIRSLDREDRRVVAEAGVILSDLHAHLDEKELRFPLTLGAAGTATIGGLVSTNAGGTQVLRHGTMRQLVGGVEAVLADGSVVSALAPLRKDNRGYDLSQLLIGAEGTLGIVTAASLKLAPAVGERIVAWIGTDGPEEALDLLRLLDRALPERIESFELLPEEALDLVCRHLPGARRPLAGAAPWHVLVEMAAPRGVETPHGLLAETLARGVADGLGSDAVIASNEAQASAFWRLRDGIAEAERKDGVAAKHDLAVPVSAMPAFIRTATEAVEGRFCGTRVLAFGHLGDGNVHFNVRAPSASGPSWLVEEATAISGFIHDLVTAAGGTLSAEHGIGQLKLGELARLADPAHLAAQRAIKTALDPHNIMNPGKLLALAETAPGP